MSDQNQNITGEQEFVISRKYNAPRSLIFKMFSEAEHLTHWWGPKGMTMKVAKLDFRPGGTFLYSQTSPEGFEMWGLFVYHDIKAPELITFVNSFADKDGNIIRAPFSEQWPLEVKNVLTLSERDGKTTLTLRGGPINATSEECKMFKGFFGNMEQGFKGTFDQLEAYLTTL